MFLSQVNFEPCSLGTPIRAGDLITHLNHLHEPPCLDLPIDVLFEDQDLVVVNKPPSYVVHPITGHRLSSILFILAAERGLKNLRTIHRIDKLTSGILILAKVGLRIYI